MELSKSWDATENSLVDLHCELTIQYWVRDQRTGLKRFRWLISDFVGIGHPPSREERATAYEITTVAATSLPVEESLPYRRILKTVRRDDTGTGSFEQSPRYAVHNFS
ncbi:MAG: hypothetical protein ACLPYY_14315 [Acidimicrobiales bacterium]